MHRRWRHVSAVVALTLVLTGTWVAPAAAKDPPKGTAGPTLQAAAIAGLAMGGDPLTKEVPLRIAIAPDLNCAVNKFEDQYGEFYGDTACATLISVNGALFGPASIPAGGSANPRTAFTPVSQTLTGSGLESDPWQITTVVDAGAAARVTQVDRYVKGYYSYQTDVTVRNVSSGSSNVRLTGRRTATSRTATSGSAGCAPRRRSRASPRPPLRTGPASPAAGSRSGRRSRWAA